MSLRLFMVEDHEVLADTLARTLRSEGYEVGLAGDLDRDAILGDVRGFGPDVVLLDIDLGDAGSGLELVGPLRELDSCVVVLTGVRDRRVLAETLEAGAVGFVSKSEGLDGLVEAIERAAAGEPVCSATVRETLLAELRALRARESEQLAHFDRLTPGEREVLQGLLDGRSAEQIAAERVVSLLTVRSQIRSILQKLGVRSQLAAVALARRSGWEAE